MLSSPDPSLSAKRALRILYADDNRFLGEVIAVHLRAAGHLVEHVDDGFEAWDRISEDMGYFQVIITDHRMPGLNGLELVDLLRQARFPGRMIAYSGALSPPEIAAYRAFGVEIVEKTTRSENLLQLIESFAHV